MKILIGITSKNRASILPKSIKSALSQDYLNKEIWVYDDASTDETKNLESLYPQVNWLFSDLPNGYLYARNLFMQKGGYDYFCSLDDDAWFVDHTAIRKALDHMQANPNIGALGFDMLTPDSPKRCNVVPYIIESNNFIGCGHIINLKAAKKIGYYTPNPGFYGGEEKDFCIRLINAGYKVVNYKSMYVWHEKTMLSRDLANQHLSGVCNDLVFTYRRAPLFILIPSILIKFYKHLKFSLTYKKEPLLKPCLQGFRFFFKWLITGKTHRNPVSLNAFTTFIKLGKRSS